MPVPAPDYTSRLGLLIYFLPYNYNSFICNDAVVTATRLQYGRYGVRIPLWSTDFFPLQYIYTSYATRTASYSIGTGVLLSDNAVGA
jgi:hypothetical protein